MSNYVVHTDKQIHTLWEALENNRKKRRLENFKKWLNSDIYHESNSELKMKVKDILENLLFETKELLESYGHVIQDEKRLRDTVTSMIYKESENELR